MALVKNAVPITFTLKVCMKKSRVARPDPSASTQEIYARIVDEDVEAPMGHAADPFYTIIIGSRSLPSGLAAAASLAEEGLTVSAIQLNITSDASISAAVQHIEKEPGCCKPNSCVCA
jgi:hypothetical protein